MIATAAGPLLGARPLEYVRSAKEEFPVGRVTHDYYQTLDVPLHGRDVCVDIPKHRSANVEWRRRLIVWAEQCPENKNAIMQMCAAGYRDRNDQRRIEATTCGIIYWINAFGWTFLQNVIEADGRQRPITAGGVDCPWILWPVQDEIVNEIVHSIEMGEDIAVDKSREMGLTWIISAVFLYYWLFRPGTNFLCLSAVEDKVDAGGDPGSIFFKFDYMMQALPAWMLPGFKRTYMKLINKETGSTIVGKSSAAH